MYVFYTVASSNDETQTQKHIKGIMQKSTSKLSFRELVDFSCYCAVYQWLVQHIFKKLFLNNVNQSTVTHYPFVNNLSACQYLLHCTE